MNILKGLSFAIAVIMMMFLFMIFGFATSPSNYVYKVVWEDNGSTKVFDKVDKYSNNRNGNTTFRDMNTGEFVDLKSGMIKTYLVEKRVNWSAWRGK